MQMLMLCQWKRHEKGTPMSVKLRPTMPEAIRAYKNNRKDVERRRRRRRLQQKGPMMDKSSPLCQLNDETASDIHKGEGARNIFLLRDTSTAHVSFIHVLVIVIFFAPDI